jgi:hypothetical protein
MIHMLQRPFSVILQISLIALLTLCPLSSNGAAWGDGPPPGSRETTSPNENRGERLQALTAHDSALDRPITVVFEISVPFSLLGPDVGPHREKCTFTATRDVRTMIVETQYDRDPIYHKPGTGGADPSDFDNQGNLLVSRSVRKQALSTAEINIMSDEQEGFRVAPDGTITALEQSRHVSFYRFPIGSPDSLYQFDQFRLAVGCGFAKYLRKVRSERVIDDKRRELVADGNYSSGFTGEWKLLLEQVEDTNVVRQAEFFVEGNPNPIRKVKTAGFLRRGEITLASEGWVSYTRGQDRDLILNVRVLDISPDPYMKQVAELRKRLSPPFPADAKIIDMGADGSPLTTPRAPEP